MLATSGPSQLLLEGTLDTQPALALTSWALFTCALQHSRSIHPTVAGCPTQVETRLKCSAEQFKWLWAIRGIVEKIMLRECRTVAETFVGYCGRLAAEGAARVPVRSLDRLPDVRCHACVCRGVAETVG